MCSWDGKEWLFLEVKEILVKGFGDWLLEWGWESN